MCDQRKNRGGPSAVSPSKVEPPPAAPSGAPRAVRLCDKRREPCDSCAELADVRVIRSDELLQGNRELLIVHGTQVYRLLCTKNNKLILQK